MPSIRSQEPSDDAALQRSRQPLAPTESPADDDSKDQFAALLRQLLDQAGKQQNWLARKLQEQGIRAKEPTVSEWVNAKSLPRTDHAVLAIQDLLRADDNRLLTLWYRGQAARKAPARQPLRPSPAVGKGENGASVPESAQPGTSPTPPPTTGPSHPGHGQAGYHFHRVRPRLWLLVGLLGVVLSVVAVATQALSPLAEPSRSTVPGPSVDGRPSAEPPADVVMHEVWRSGEQAHLHMLGYRQWAMTEFRATRPLLRSVEVNVAGPLTTNLIVYRHRRGMTRPWQFVTRPVPVAVVANGHTKVIFNPPVPVQVGETLFLQVLNVERTKLAVYFSNRHEASGRSYLWCRGPTLSCVHRHDLNAIVYGWGRSA